jgi:4-oxalocrotonate tautomerase family enzyme
MPVITFVSVPMSAEDKAQLIARITDATTEVTHCAAETVVVLFHDLSAEAIGVGGRSLQTRCNPR